MRRQHMRLNRLGFLLASQAQHHAANNISDHGLHKDSAITTGSSHEEVDWVTVSVKFSSWRADEPERGRKHVQHTAHHTAAGAHFEKGALHHTVALLLAEV